MISRYLKLDIFILHYETKILWLLLFLLTQNLNNMYCISNPLYGNKKLMHKFPYSEDYWRLTFCVLNLHKINLNKLSYQNYFNFLMETKSKKWEDDSSFHRMLSSIFFQARTILSSSSTSFLNHKFRMWFFEHLHPFRRSCLYHRLRSKWGVHNLLVVCSEPKVFFKSS